MCSDVFCSMFAADSLSTIGAPLDCVPSDILLLNVRRRLIVNPVIVSAGTKDAELVIPRDVFRPAIREGAVAVLAAHNHLSEDVSPSDEDIELTRLLQETEETVGIPLLDHVIQSSIPSCDQWKSTHMNLLEK